LKDARSSESSSVADSPRMKPVDSSAKMGNLERKVSMSASDSCDLLLLVGGRPRPRVQPRQVRFCGEDVLVQYLREA
jgi:hypothetical protein